nr:alpha/beta hydrolase fold domain-containing protein [Kineococcus siccus]
MTRAGRGYTSADEARRHVEERRLRPRPYGPPRGLRRDVTVSVEDVDGWPVYRLAPRAGGARGGVVYAHGGGWVNEISRQHWQLTARIAAQVRTTVTVPIYPLVPVGTAEEVVAGVAALVTASEARHGATSLAGDSAGGQIALSTALLLREEQRVRVPRTVLIAPALDLSLANPAIDAVEPTDPWLGRAGTHVYVEHWRGDLPVHDPRVSPLAGDLAGLGPLTVFSGTRDVLNPDARLLVARARAAGVEVDDHWGDGLVHVYPLLPTPEGRAARAVLLDALQAARPRD